MSDGTKPSQNGRVAAFFDLDRTLIVANSGRLWMRRELRHGRISWRQMARGLWWLTLYHFGRIDIERAMDEALHTIVGLDEETLRRWTHEWYRDEVAQLAAPGAASVLDEHRRQGHPLVLLTSSSPYASECAVEQFGLDDALSTAYEVEDDRFTGKFVLPLCFGDGKVAWAERWAVDNGVDLDRSYFYTDSATDLPMLLRVGEPRPVNADPKLRREARRRGWPLLDWREE